MRYFVYGVIVLFWASMTLLYVEKEVIAPARERERAEKNRPVSFPRGRIRLRVERAGKMMGRIDTTYIPQKNGTCTIYNRVTYNFGGSSFMLMALPALEIESSNFARLAKDGTMTEFTSQVNLRVSKKEEKITIQGEKKEGKYNLTITYGKNQKMTTQVKEVPILPGDSPFSTTSKLEVGQDWKRYNQLTKTTYQIRVAKKGTFFFDGKPRDAFLLEGKIKNSPSPPFQAWVDPQGQIYRAEFPDGRVLIRESVKRKKNL